MVPVEKMQELGAVVNFWKARVGGLNSELGMLHDLRMHGRPSGDRYAADRLLREIKKKALELGDAERALRIAERELLAATDSLRHLTREPSASPAASPRTAH